MNRGTTIAVLDAIVYWRVHRHVNFLLFQESGYRNRQVYDLFLFASNMLDRMLGEYPHCFPHRRYA